MPTGKNAQHQQAILASEDCQECCAGLCSASQVEKPAVARLRDLVLPVKGRIVTG